MTTFPIGNDFIYNLVSSTSFGQLTNGSQGELLQRSWPAQDGLLELLPGFSSLTPLLNQTSPVSVRTWSAEGFLNLLPGFSSLTPLLNQTSPVSVRSFSATSTLNLDLPNSPTCGPWPTLPTTGQIWPLDNNLYNYVAYIFSFSPTTLTAGSGIVTLTVNGQNFTAGATATVGGNATPITFVSTSQVTLEVDTDALAAGTPTVAITTATGTATKNITVEPPPLPIPLPNLWLDASNPGDVSVDGSNLVTSWADRLNGDIYAPTTPTDGPTLVSSGINGLPTLQWPSVNSNANLLRSLGSSTLPCNTIYMVAQWLGPSGFSYRNCLFSDGAGNNKVWGNPFQTGLWFSNGYFPEVMSANGGPNLYPNLDFTSTLPNPTLVKAGRTNNNNTVDLINTIGIGCDAEYPLGQNRGWCGYIGEVIMYSSALTPQEETQVIDYLTNKWLPPAPPPTDPYFANVSLLIQPTTETNGQITFTDKSNNSFPITAIGDTKWDTGEMLFGKPTVLFDSTGDYLTVPCTSPVFDMETGLLTAEFWIWLPSIPGTYGMLADARGNTANLEPYSFGLYNVSGALRVDVIGGTGGARLTGTDTSVSAGSWNFIQVIRSGGGASEITLRVNGVEDSLRVGDFGLWDPTNNTMFIGVDCGITSFLNGRIGAMRITKGVARPNVVPTAPFPTS